MLNIQKSRLRNANDVDVLLCYCKHLTLWLCAFTLTNEWTKYYVFSPPRYPVCNQSWKNHASTRSQNAVPCANVWVLGGPHSASANEKCVVNNSIKFARREWRAAGSKPACERLCTRSVPRYGLLMRHLKHIAKLESYHKVVWRELFKMSLKTDLCCIKRLNIQNRSNRDQINNMNNI